MRPRALVASGLTLALVGCASLIDINRLEAPPDGADGGPDGGACLKSAEAGAVTLVSYPRGVTTAVDDTYVYFTHVDPPTNSAILRCPKCGCDVPEVLASNLNQPGGLAVDENSVFWTDTVTKGSVHRLQKADPTNQQSIPTGDSPIGIAVDDVSVYWTVIGGAKIQEGGVFRANKLTLGNVTQLEQTTVSQDNSDLIPVAIAVAGADLYYATAPDLNDQSQTQPCGIGTPPTGAVRRVQSTGLSLQRSQVLATGQPCPFSIAVGPDAVYWVNLGITDGSIWSAKRQSSPAAAALIPAVGHPTSLAFNGTTLTWNSLTSLTLLACTPADCAATMTTAADGQLAPSGLSMDATNVYWATLGTPQKAFKDGTLSKATVQ